MTEKKAPTETKVPLVFRRQGVLFVDLVEGEFKEKAGRRKDKPTTTFLSNGEMVGGFKEALRILSGNVGTKNEIPTDPERQKDDRFFVVSSINNIMARRSIVKTRHGEDARDIITSLLSDAEQTDYYDVILPIQSLIKRKGARSDIETKLIEGIGAVITDTPMLIDENSTKDPWGILAKHYKRVAEHQRKQRHKQSPKNGK